MTRGLVEPELGELRQAAEALARRQKSPVNTAHLLAAMASRPSATQELLVARGLDAEAILARANGLEDTLPDAIKALVERARAVASRTGNHDTGAPHLLVALLHERRSAGYQLALGAGVDVPRLRSKALNVALGLIARRRVVTQPAVVKHVPAAPCLRARSQEKRSPGVVIPLVPPLPKKPPVSGPTPVPPTERSKESDAPSPAAPPDNRGRVAVHRPKTSMVKRFELDPQRQPNLTSLGKNLTLAAQRGELDRVVGRNDEIDSVLDVLAKRHGNCPVLVGAPGVGKTSVVRGLAQRIACAAFIDPLDDRIVIELPVAELIAGTGVRGALAGRLGALRKEIASSPGKVVLFLDEIHQLFAGDMMDEIASDLRLALGKGELVCIGATSTSDYARHIESDPTLARRFTPIEVAEPGREDAFLILECVAEKLGSHHHVAYGAETLAVAINWSSRYLPGKALPDKAISILDLAGARSRRRRLGELTVEVVAEVVAELADIPVSRLLETDTDRMLELEHILGERVVGHEQQLARIARILRRNTAGLGSNRPLGTFLLLGPTGVGKTETAKAVAEVLFGSEHAMTRLDLSEFSEPHTIARLIGAPPGYVGHEAGGQLTEAVRRRPYQVILLDEVEKAHRDVLMAFLSVFDEGRLTDGRGRRVDFSNTVILMTSNLGADVSGAVRRRRVGFGNDSMPDRAELEQAVIGAARAALAPELYNRIDEVLVLAPLSRSEVREVAQRLLGALGRSIAAQRGVDLEWDGDLLDFLLDQGGYEPSLGARPMKRTLARLVEAPLAEWILRGKAERGTHLRLKVRRGGLEIRAVT